MIAELRIIYPELSVRHLCQLLGVNRAWLSARPTQPPHAERDVELRDAIEDVVLEFPGYGYRRVTKALQREGRQVNHKRVLRVMRQESLLCVRKRAFVSTTDSAHGVATDPNLRASVELSGIDQAWVADSTAIKLPTTFV